MDCPSIEDPTGNTKTRLLNAAEQLYARAGTEGLSLRDLTELAGVNLAAVNYHFGSKNALVCAMVARRLDPVNAQRLAELARLEQHMGDNVRCEHVITALARPLMSEPFDIVGSQENREFALRAASELGQPLREFLTQRYAPVEKKYMVAFQRTAPWLTSEELIWRLNCIAFALPGIGINASAVQSLRKTVNEQFIDKMQVLGRFAATICALLNAPQPEKNLMETANALFSAPRSVAA